MAVDLAAVSVLASVPCRRPEQANGRGHGEQYAHVGFGHLDIYQTRGGAETHTRVALDRRLAEPEDVLVAGRRLLIDAGWAIDRFGWREPLDPSRKDLIATCSLIRLQRAR